MKEQPSPTDALMNAWLETQKSWMDNWGRMLQPSVLSNLGGAMPAYNPFLPGMMGQWATMANQTANAMNEFGAMTLRAVSGQMDVMQQQMTHLLPMMAGAWQAMAAAPAGDWQRALADHAEQMRSQMMANVATMNKTVVSGQFGGFGPSMWKGISPAEMAESGLRAYEQTAGRFLTSPTLGLNRNLLALLNQAQKAWVETRITEVEYNELISQAWSGAFRAYMTRLVEMAQRGEPAESMRQMLDLWVEVADPKFFDLFHSDEFAAVQGRYLNSSMTLKRVQRDLLEVWLRANDMPTRSDLDEAHHAIYLLRKEVKELKKTLAAQNAATMTQPQSATGTESTPAHKRATRTKKPTAVAKPAAGKK